MSTTIDSLQLEIRSSSNNAAKGIDDLAASLERLKKNGSFKTVSTNLNNLSGALKNLPNVHSASNSLRTLANSIEKLKGVGTVSSLSNSLKKLPEALKSLESINLGNAKAQIQSVADAVYPLTQVRGSGFSSMVNSMKKLGDVTKGLDDDTITAFANRVEILNEKLGPLSQKMSAVKMGFSAINTNARSATAGVKDFGDGVNTSTLNLSNFIDVARTATDMVMGLVQKFAEFMHDATQWDGIEYQFGNAFGEQADIYYKKITKITDALNINKQMFMENSAMATSMLIGFGVDSADAREMGLGYTELAYDIWAAYNNVYETLDGADGAMAAVRSAIAGEVEPIRRAGFTIVESQLEQTAANHGLEISIESATEAQKSYLRYLELVDQAHIKGVVGTYASEMDEAEGMVRQLKQQWVSLTQAFASLFIPVLVEILPYIHAVVDLLKEGVYWVAELLNIDIQAVDFTDYKTGASAIKNVGISADGATDALNGASEAAKDLKNATLGIDELNVISPRASTSEGDSNGAGNGGGSSELPINSIWDAAIFDGVKQDIDEVKERLRGWMPTIATVAGALAGLRLVGLIEDLKVISTTGGLISGAVAAFKFIKDYVMAVVAMAPEVGLLAAMFPKISGWIATITPALTGAVEAVGAFIAGISAPAWAAIAAIIAAVAAAVYFLVQNWDALVQATKNWIELNIAPIFDEFKATCTALWGAMQELWASIVNVGVSLWNILPDWLQDTLYNIAVGVKECASAFWEWLSSVEWFELFGEAVEWLGGWVVANLGGVIGGAISAVLNLVESAVQVVTGVVQIISGTLSGFINLIVALFTGDFGKALDSVELIWEGIKNIFLGATDAVIGTVWAFVKGVIDWFAEMFDVLVGHSIVPDTVNKIVEWFTGFPSEVIDSIKKFATDIIGNFKEIGKNVMSGIIDGIKSIDMFASVKEKFDGFVSGVKGFFGIKSPSRLMKDEIGSYLIPGITEGMGMNGIKDKLSSVWNTAKTWWNDKKGSMKTYTPSIGSIYEKVKDRWDNARDWWNNKKSAMKTYTPSIGSIYEKVYDRWKNARDWWNKSKGSMSYTPSIGSIKDKIVSAWNTAKKWWSSNAKLSTKLDIKVPTIKVKWDTASAFGKSFKYPTGFSLKFAANGGIFDAGSLIWAGERGPEIVANASGGKTGVMNVQQMQEAVYDGVYAAVVAAMRGNNDGKVQSVNVYLDGRQITAAVEQRQRERGASLMGNEVYSY